MMLLCVNRSEEASNTASQGPAEIQLQIQTTQEFGGFILSHWFFFHQVDVSLRI